MAITTKLATRYWLKTVIMAIVCILFGVWGIWDYTVVIPRAETESARAAVLRVVKNGLDTPKDSEFRSKALVLLATAIDQDEHQDEEWSASLITMRNAVRGGDIETLRSAAEIVEEKLQLYGSVTTPDAYDRPVQWLFIICLPFGFYYFWKYWKMSIRASMFRLEDDGTLVTPDGEWSAEKIADIDMSRWVAKTGNARSTWTAKAVMVDGTAVLLDDYIYQDMHLIIGTLAHQFYPEDWTPLAKRIKGEADSGDDSLEDISDNDESGDVSGNDESGDVSSHDKNGGMTEEE